MDAEVEPHGSVMRLLKKILKAFIKFRLGIQNAF
jgi:hypothetical protein